MTKIPSVEKEIEYLRFAMRGGCNCKGCEDDRANIGEHCVIRQALTADRTALILEVRKVLAFEGVLSMSVEKALSEINPTH